MNKHILAVLALVVGCVGEPGGSDTGTLTETTATTSTTTTDTGTTTPTTDTTTTTTTTTPTTTTTTTTPTTTTTTTTTTPTTTTTTTTVPAVVYVDTAFLMDIAVYPRGGAVGTTAYDDCVGTLTLEVDGADLDVSGGCFSTTYGTYWDVFGTGTVTAATSSGTVTITHFSGGTVDLPFTGVVDAALATLDFAGTWQYLPTLWMDLSGSADALP